VSATRAGTFDTMIREMACYLRVSTKGKTFLRVEIECLGFSGAFEKAYHLFNERPELRVLEVWQDSCMLFKLERH
jgi:hypothetical protein